MAWRAAKHRKLDAVLARCERAAHRARKRATRHGLDSHTAGIKGNQAYHQRRQQLLTKRGIDDAALSARADELDRAERTPEELAEHDRIEQWFGQRDAEHAQEFEQEEIEAEQEVQRRGAEQLRAIEAERQRENDLGL